MKRLIKKLIRENLLLEAEVFPYEQTRETDTFIEYSFTTDGLEYVVNLTTNKERQMYELGFGVVGHEDSAHRTSKDVKHLNSVLQTVDSIVANAVKKYRIKKIVFSGARGETDSDIAFIAPIRLKVYLRYLKQHHPNAKIENDRFGNVDVFMNSIYPEVFKENKDNKEMFLEIISAISDENPNDWRFDSNYVLDNGNLSGESDAIENSELGPMLIGIDSDIYYKTYDLRIEIFDTSEEIHKQFKNFNEVLNFLKEKFLTSQHEEIEPENEAEQIFHLLAMATPPKNPNEPNTNLTSDIFAKYKGDDENFAFISHPINGFVYEIRNEPWYGYERTNIKNNQKSHEGFETFHELYDKLKQMLLK